MISILHVDFICNPLFALATTFLDENGRYPVLKGVLNELKINEKYIYLRKITYLLT